MKRLDLIIFTVVLIIVNMPLLFGGFSDQLAYYPEKVISGQWWRLITHPFVHVSLYHLLLDGAAFLMLYAQLAEKRVFQRIAYLLGIHTAVLLGVTWGLPHVQAAGYCGLSGVAHGVMALWCMERMGGQHAKVEQRLGICIFVGLLAKCIYEVSTGHVFFESMHFGSVGVPVVVSHLAGVVGAVVTYALLNMSHLRITKKQLRDIISAPLSRIDPGLADRAFGIRGCDPAKTKMDTAKDHKPVLLKKKQVA